ncbi:sulfatase [Desulfosporosinus sp. FKA]|uniref:sulfatase n=1 Tax=Desulfosporosinus sp. FKA TaxID=1969834 RepID=UPI000B499963|nr:sulfatase [Desulfosporosinus sp. FKA]
MNVVFVISDTFRRDNLSCYGPTPVKTPNLDRLAEESYVFDNAYLGSFPTVPNRLDIMNGRFNFIDHEWCPLPSETVTLQQILSASGVVTQMVIDNPHLIENGFNYERGFDGWEWIRGHESDRWKVLPKEVTLPAHPSKLNNAHFVLPNYLRNTAWWKSEEDHFAARSVTEACNWLEEGQNAEKFFLYVDLFDPHEPWDAPKEYVDMYDKGYEGEEVIYPYNDYWENIMSEAELNHCRALYRAKVSMVDHWIGILREKVKKLGLEEDTAFVFTSDHGYLFGEHGQIGKAFKPENGYYEACRMYNEMRRIPLMIHLPGQKKSERIGALVQSPDLMPTILDLCGLVASKSFGGKANIQALQCGIFYTKDWRFEPESIHGKSLMPLIRGEVDKLRDFVVCSNTIIHHTPVVSKCAVVTEDGWCLHYSGYYDEVLKESVKVNKVLIELQPSKGKVEPELYYLPDDPNEEHNLIEGHEDLAREIHARYVKWLEEVGTPEEHLAGRRKLVLK